METLTTKKMETIRCYSELIKYDSFKDRYNYLRLSGVVGADTFGFDRYWNQKFYRSARWKKIRDEVIIRDGGFDLGVEGYQIYGKIYIHHMNPITVDDIMGETDLLLNPEYMICVSHATHQAIHYGDESQIIIEPTIRTKNDTCPWKH